MAGPDDGVEAAAIDPAERLLAAFGGELAAAWRRAFVLVRGGATWLLGHAPTIAAVDRLLLGPAIAVDEGLRCLEFPAEGEPPARHLLRGAPRPVDGARPINLPDAEASFPALRPLARALARRFAAPVNLQLFRGRGGVGLRPHRDIHDSFIVQLSGVKRWTIEDPDPEDRSFGNQGGAFGPGARTIELRPGDLLYKPSHGLHATAGASAETLSLTASIVTLTAAEALAHWLRAATAVDPLWRTRLPADAAELAALGEALRELPWPTAAELAAVSLALARAADEDDDAADDDDG